MAEPKDDPGFTDAEDIEFPSTGKDLLKQYSGIPSEDVLAHALRIRDKAYRVCPYFCIGQGRFLDYKLPLHPYYGPVLERLRGGGTFLDAGCCFGQDLRFLAWKEHIPGAQLYGVDLEPAFIEFGYELFRDKDKLGATLLSGDLLAGPSAPASQELALIEGKMDVIHVASVLHVWAWDRMLQAAKRLVSLSRPRAGSIIVGSQMGSSSPGEYPTPMAKQFETHYRHDPQSMQRFWKQVGEETGTSWEVEAGMYMSEVIEQNSHNSWAKMDPGMGMLWFMATRI
ncbi:hypothetical protein DFH06DRAFT_184831 [Mycena polygramma]|nr:hypothetical protein DFH06DRAFT_184831 [Mycena polygramma]